VTKVQTINKHKKNRYKTMAYKKTA